ncbi:hypothetical protein PsYK624_137210 [Phanerochaete sordida]|uniref:Uncharacterized protein n=1 Tax=Phanerochaete sordida TaxID=48140 RepID=A0A9P3GQ46_9APHY|nr:hypothetical protein PsYK624_137210 [Phanerochaete sordida]
MSPTTVSRPSLPVGRILHIVPIVLAEQLDDPSACRDADKTSLTNLPLRERLREHSDLVQLLLPSPQKSSRSCKLGQRQPFAAASVDAKMCPISTSPTPESSTS